MSCSPPSQSNREPIPHTPPPPHTHINKQVDGEPWRVPRCELTLRHKGQAPVLQHLSQVRSCKTSIDRPPYTHLYLCLCKISTHIPPASTFLKLKQELLQYNEWLVRQGKLDGKNKLGASAIFKAIKPSTRMHPPPPNSRGQGPAAQRIQTKNRRRAMMTGEIGRQISPPPHHQSSFCIVIWREWNVLGTALCGSCVHRKAHREEGDGGGTRLCLLDCLIEWTRKGV